MAGFKITSQSVSKGLEGIKSTNEQSLLSKAGKSESGSNDSFLDHLKEGIKDVNRLQKNADKMTVEVAAGKSENLHETMLALTQAELSFNLMVQVRNKGLEAYQEIMRMQV